MQLLNQHSYVLLAVVALAIAASLSLRFLHGPARAVPIAIAVLLLATGILVLRKGPSTLDSAEAVEAAIGAGKPVLLVFYSDF